MTNQAQIQKHEGLAKHRVSRKQRRRKRASFRADGSAMQDLLAHPGSASAQDIVTLQRTVGNQATTHFIQAKLRVGPVGDHYEREADRVAQQVLAMPETRSRPQVQRQEEEEELQAKPLASTISPLVQRQEDEEELQLKLVQRQEDEEELQMKSRGNGGFTVDAGTESRLKSLGGSGKPLSKELRSFMEPRFGANFNSVRVHTGSKAAQISRQINAKAFTHGQDIYFGVGMYQPETDNGKQLLAHELTHVVQQTGAAQRKPQSSQVLQAKMKGSAGALAAVSTHGRGWNNILSALRNYEVLETTQVKRVQTFKRLQQQTQMMKEVYKTQAPTLTKRTVAEKKEINKRLNELRAKLIQIRQQSLEWINRSKHQKSKEERTHQRMAALKMLLPRIETEIDDLNSGRFEKTVASGNLSVIKFEAVGGQLNKLDLVKVGGTEGFFTEDRPRLTAQDKSGPAPDLGIPTEDPRLGARSVAMYRLDQLLGINMLAKTEFAVSQRRDQTGKLTEKMGVFMEKAKGEKAETLAKGGRLAEDDTMLQRALNKLQMLDVICGQVDRHMGNYYIAMSDGKVTGVQGIDNDMSFGVAHTGLEKAPGGIHYKGIPPIVDSETAKRILAIKGSDVEAALKGLLSPPEVANTVSRLSKFQAELLKMQAKNLFVDQWGTPETTKTLREGKESYASIAMEVSGAGQIKQALIDGGYLNILKPIAQARFDSAYNNVKELGGEEEYRKMTGLEPPTLEGVTEELLSGTAQGIWKSYVKTGKVTLGEAIDIARRAGKEMSPGGDIMPFYEKTLSETVAEKKGQ
jgi:hypothetical protein